MVKLNQEEENKEDKIKLDGLKYKHDDLFMLDEVNIVFQSDIINITELSKNKLYFPDYDIKWVSHQNYIELKLHNKKIIK